MATNIKDETIASTYDRIVLIEDGTTIGDDTATANIEIQTPAGVAHGTPLHISKNRIGIAEASPDYLLDIGDVSGSVTQDVWVRIKCDAGGGSNKAGILLAAEEVSQWWIGLHDGDSGKLKIEDAGGDTHLCIQQDGKVGINTQSPDYWFQVSAGSDEDAAGFYSGDDCVRIVLEDDDTSHNMYIGHSSDNNCAFIGYAGGTGTATGNLNINRDGHVGIGCTPNATFPLDVRTNTASQYAAFFVNNGDNANRYGIKLQCGASDGSGTTYYMRCDDGNGDPIGYIAQHSADLKFIQDSDIRLKKDVIDTTIKGLDTINAIKVRDFKWKKNNISVVAGFIANELKTVFPSAVVGTEDAMEDILDDDGKKTGERIAPMGVAKQELVPVLIKAVQELSARVTALESA